MKKRSKLLLRSCSKCPRLFDERLRIKKQYPDYWSEPVSQWGDPKAKILVVGLAPGLQGAVRTGRTFVGDSSGAFLFSGLFRNGLSDNPTPRLAKLQGVRLTNAVKCFPPANKPTGPEIKNCQFFLKQELEPFSRSRNRDKRALILLGRVAHIATYTALGIRGPSFGHGAVHLLNPKLGIFASFHPSRLNVNTKRLTSEMLDAVLRAAKNFVI